MKEAGGYGQFCPVAMAAEVLCTRRISIVQRVQIGRAHV